MYVKRQKRLTKKGQCFNECSLTDVIACMGQSKNGRNTGPVLLPSCFATTSHRSESNTVNKNRSSSMFPLKVGSKKVLEMESSRNLNSTVEKEDDLLVDSAEAEALKKRISSHPLYGLLVQTHIDCLKVGNRDDVDEIPRVPFQIPHPSSLSQPELDSFMEAYCFALSKLKEAIEKPQQETVAFINSMHLQLKELTRTHSKIAEHSSSGKRND